MNLSPNFSKGTRPKIGYIIHGTLGSYEGAVNWLCTPPEKRPVISYSSAHYVIAKDGRVASLIADTDVAWHAGNISSPTPRAQQLLPKVNGSFLNPNESFIGIELEWFLGDKVTEAQYAAMVKIITTGGIKNPVLLTHKEVTNYKSDFQNAAGIVDTTILSEIQKRMAPVVVKPPVDAAKAQEFLDTVNAKFTAKDFKGARDACSYLYTELSKLSSQ